jgi:hypothetical protein
MNEGRLTAELGDLFASEDMSEWARQAAEMTVEDVAKNLDSLTLRGHINRRNLSRDELLTAREMLSENKQASAEGYRKHQEIGEKYFDLNKRTKGAYDKYLLMNDEFLSRTVQNLMDDPRSTYDIPLYRDVPDPRMGNLSTDDLFNSPNPYVSRETDTSASALRGLDMSQGARMQRAQDLEFDTERTAYRGLSGEYDPNKAGNYQMFTSSPEDAGEYGSNVVSSYLRKGNNLVVEGGRNNFNSIPVRNLPDAVRANLHSSVGSVARTDDIAYAAQAAGYDSVSINNVFDKASNEIPLKPPPASNAPMSQEMMDLLDEVDASGMLNNTPDVALPPEIPRNYDPTTIDIIFDPKNIRSIEAEFDPTKADSADLLSSRQSERQMSALRGIA